MKMKVVITHGWKVEFEPKNATLGQKTEPRYEDPVLYIRIIKTVNKLWPNC